MSDPLGMHTKVNNFFSFLADSYIKYFLVSPKLEEEEKEEEDNKPVKDDEFSFVVRTACNTVENYQAFYFGWLALASNSEKIKPRVLMLRELHNNPQELKGAVEKIRSFAAKAKEALCKIEALPDEEIINFIKTLSRYLKLFTLVYIKDK